MERGNRKSAAKFIRYLSRIYDSQYERRQFGILLFGYVIGIRVVGKLSHDVQQQCCDKITIEEESKFGQAPSETWRWDQKIAWDLMNLTNVQIHST
jgi:hypothetical protein